jgi:hypothetical protein
MSFRAVAASPQQFHQELAHRDAGPSVGASFHHEGWVVVDGSDWLMGSLPGPQSLPGVAGATPSLPRSPVVVRRKNLMLPICARVPLVSAAGGCLAWSV